MTPAPSARTAVAVMVDLKETMMIVDVVVDRVV
jgi:hypothetical protein